MSTTTVDRLRSAVTDAETAREQAWDHRTEEGHDYQAAASNVFDVRRRLAEAVAVEQGKGDFGVTITVRDLNVTSETEAETEALRRILIGGPGITLTTELPTLRPVVVEHKAGDPPRVTYVACAVCGAESDEWQYEEDEWTKRTNVVPFVEKDGTVTVTVGGATDHCDDGGNDDPGLVCGTCSYRIDADVTDWT